jgi:hypothetical protein
MANDMILGFGGVAARDCRPVPVCDPRPVCPACGGLECMCRPRFFAGQLLTEEDLNRLDHYIVAKNRLHNRHLFGTGVVCGLEVVCNYCDPAGNGTVVVSPGYALSPCGNDIVVCKQTPVDVCDLVNRCRPRADDCFQPGRDGQNRGNDDRDQGNDEWVLAICYQEKPSRGITALRAAACGCGGKTSGGCGCGGDHASTTSYGGGALAGEASCGCGGGAGSRTSRTKAAAKAGPRPPQCEPTLTCESYSFAVYRMPPEDRGRERADPGALIRRFICCLLPLFEQLTKFPTNNPTQKQLQDWLTNFIAVAREFLITEGLYDCDVTARLNGVVVPLPGGALQQYVNTWTTAVVAVLEILAAVFQKCLCAALLPPCPPPELNDCVPIATLTVARGHCRVTHICNISNRRFLVTWPTVQYWLSWLPLFSSWIPGGTTLRKLIDAICCTPVAGMFGFLAAGDVQLVKGQQQPAGVVPLPVAAPRASAGQPVQPEVAASAAGIREHQALHPFTHLLGESLLGDHQVNAATLLLAALGATHKDGSALVSDVDLQYPGQAMLIHQIVGPALAPLVPLLGGLAARGADTAELERSIETLKKKVDELQAAINKPKR